MRTISIDEKRCNGCGLCVNACHEGALELISEKAVLKRPNLCDRMGDCLPTCPQNAISFIEEKERPIDLMADPGYQWPIQLNLVSPFMGRFIDEIVIAADCTAFTFNGDFKSRFIGRKGFAIGCPKLDSMERFEKITEILKNNEVTAVRVIRIDIPCCNILMNILKECIIKSGKNIELKETVIGRTGNILNE